MASSLVYASILQNDRYQIKNGTEYTVPQDGSVISIDIAKDGVPIEAYEVILYVYVRSGKLGGQYDGYFIFSTSTTNGNIERFLYFRTYEQEAYSYNSESIYLPVGKERIVSAKIDSRRNNPRLTCKVQVIGYRKPPT